MVGASEEFIMQVNPIYSQPTVLENVSSTLGCTQPAQLTGQLGSSSSLAQTRTQDQARMSPEWRQEVAPVKAIQTGWSGWGGNQHANLNALLQNFFEEEDADESEVRGTFSAQSDLFPKPGTSAPASSTSVRGEWGEMKRTGR
jgi:hypothetical protein